MKAIYQIMALHIHYGINNNNYEGEYIVLQHNITKEIISGYGITNIAHQIGTNASNLRLMLDGAKGRKSCKGYSPYKE